MDKVKVIEALRWFVTFRNPKEIFADQTSFLAVEVLFYICFILILKHALRNGGRFLYLLMSTIMFGLAMENLSFNLPVADNFWHAQSSVMLLGQRLPLHIIFFYPIIIYTASVAVSRMKLPLWSEMCAVGIATVILDFPFDVTGIKLLWWTFHDTDPNIHERFYWVPWNSFFFFASFTSSLTFCLHSLRKVITGNTKYQQAGFLKEFAAAFLAAILAIPLGVLQFSLFYHAPHDIYKIPASMCFTTHLILLGLLAWTGDRGAGSMRLSKATGNIQKKVDELSIMILIYFSFFFALVFVAQPQNIFSVGSHQPIGNCNEKVPIHTPIGMVLSRNKYLCPTNYDEGYYDFHCAMQPTKTWKYKEWYIICGTPFENRYEYIAMITGAAIYGIYFFYQLLMNSGKDVSSDIYSKLKAKLT